METSVRRCLGVVVVVGFPSWAAEGEGGFVTPLPYRTSAMLRCRRHPHVKRRACAGIFRVYL